MRCSHLIQVQSAASNRLKNCHVRETPQGSHSEMSLGWAVFIQVTLREQGTGGGDALKTVSISFCIVCCLLIHISRENKITFETESGEKNHFRNSSNNFEAAMQICQLHRSLGTSEYEI